VGAGDLVVVLLLLPPIVMTFLLACVGVWERAVDESLESVLAAGAGAGGVSFFLPPMLSETTAGLSELVLICLSRVVEESERVLEPLLLTVAVAPDEA
jgi:hypothetical protein